MAPLEWLLGTWHGSAEGKPGRGVQERRYEAVLRGEFIMGTNRTTWSPSKEHPDGEVHEDLCVISYDSAAKRFVMHMFYVERFFAEYVCAEPEDDRWVFTAERVQNGPPGMRARETLGRHGALLDTRFELAMGDKEFAVYTRETLARR